MILSHALYELFLYFLFYSFLGWLMETCYCSLRARRLVPRGFLYGPLCPIYGCGVLLMLLFFTPLKGNIPLFYVTAVVVMTGWEYLVGWFLETTTHMKYWDYSEERFNLKGRVCLWVALVWGALSYVIIFWVHPAVERLYLCLPVRLAYALCGVSGAALLADMALTIRQLALISRLVVSATAAGEELRLQLSLGRAELSDKLAQVRTELDHKLYEGRERADERLEQLRERYRDQLARLERHSRRFRNNYSHMSVGSRYAISREDLRAAVELAKEELQKKKDERRAARKAGR